MWQSGSGDIRVLWFDTLEGMWYLYYDYLLKCVISETILILHIIWFYLMKYGKKKQTLIRAFLWEPSGMDLHQRLYVEHSRIYMTRFVHEVIFECMQMCVCIHLQKSFWGILIGPSQIEWPGPVFTNSHKLKLLRLMLKFSFFSKTHTLLCSLQTHSISISSSNGSKFCTLPCSRAIPSSNGS